MREHERRLMSVFEAIPGTGSMVSAYTVQTNVWFKMQISRVVNLR